MWRHARDYPLPCGCTNGLAFNTTKAHNAQKAATDVCSNYASSGLTRVIHCNKNSLSVPTSPLHRVFMQHMYTRKVPLLPCLYEVTSQLLRSARSVEGSDSHSDVTSLFWLSNWVTSAAAVVNTPDKTAAWLYRFTTCTVLATLTWTTHWVR